MQITGAEIIPLYEAALRGGIQVATHAIGDRGNASVEEWYAAALETVPASDRPNGADVRWRIEHAQILRPSDYHWFRDLPIIASMQPSHAIGDLHFAPARLGDARLDGAYAWRSLSDMGVIVVGGSDAPVERGDPLIEFYAAVARKDLSGFTGEGWHPEEAVTRAQALALGWRCVVPHFRGCSGELNRLPRAATQVSETTLSRYGYTQPIDTGAMRLQRRDTPPLSP